MKKFLVVVLFLLFACAGVAQAWERTTVRSGSGGFSIGSVGCGPGGCSSIRYNAERSGGSTGFTSNYRYNRGGYRQSYVAPQSGGSDAPCAEFFAAPILERQCLARYGISPRQEYMPSQDTETPKACLGYRNNPPALANCIAGVERAAEQNQRDLVNEAGRVGYESARKRR